MFLKFSRTNECYKISKHKINRCALCIRLRNFPQRAKMYTNVFCAIEPTCNYMLQTLSLDFDEVEKKPFLSPTSFYISSGNYVL